MLRAWKQSPEAWSTDLDALEMAHPRSRSPYALRQLKSPLGNISSLGLAGLKSTGTFVIQGVTHGQVPCAYLGLVPWTTNTTPGGFDEQRFQKGGLKGALVVVVEVVVVVTTTATPSTFETWTKGHLRLSSDLRRPRSLGSLLREGSSGNHHWVS